MECLASFDTELSWLLSLEVIIILSKLDIRDSSSSLLRRRVHGLIGLHARTTGFTFVCIK